MDRHLTDIEFESLLDSALEADAARIAAAHLDHCRACRGRLEGRARLFEAIEAWEEQPIPRDLAARIMTSLSPAPAPLGLRVATVVQAGVVVLIAAVLWPLAERVLTSVRIPVGPIVTPESIGMVVAQLSEPVLLARAQVLDSISALAGGLRATPGWVSAWPLVIAGAVAVFVVGNSILLRGDRDSAEDARRLW